MNEPDDNSVDFDDFEPSFSPDFDVELDDDAGNRLVGVQSAWQRLDERNDDKWLKEQLSDWDDWDESDDAGLH